jgi:putative DNA primase/helicase
MSADLTYLTARGGRRAVEQQLGAPDTPSEDAVALEFVRRFKDHLYVAQRGWLLWDGKRWHEDSTALIFHKIRTLVRELAIDGKSERRTANAGFVAGVERLLRADQQLVVLPEQLDANPWLLNTQSGTVDLRTGLLAPHRREDLCTCITSASLDAGQGRELFADFLEAITQGDADLRFYLQRLMGYCTTGLTIEESSPTSSASAPTARAASRKRSSTCWATTPRCSPRKC